MNELLPKRCWYPAFVIYRWRHILWSVPVLALLGVLVLHWNRLRWDHVIAVVQPRPTAVVLAGRTAPVWLSDQIDVICSPEVLGKAASESGLTAAWRMREAEAAERLRSDVICEAIPGTTLIELKVRKLSGGDALLACTAISKHAGERLDADRAAENAKVAAERKAVVEKALVELESKLEVTRAEFLAETPTRENPGDEALRFELLVKIQADRRMLEELKHQMASEEMNPRCGMGGALIEHEAAHWPGRPSTQHLLAFGIATAWTSGISVLAALALAYLLEALIPRKKMEELIPEGEPAHG